MRFLTSTLLYALYATNVVSATSGKDGEKEKATDDNKPTIFNGVEVPPLPVIDGEKFNETVKDGWWFVKHHS